MKKRFFSLILLSVFICSLLTACSSDTNSAVSGPNSSYSTGIPQKEEIATSVDWIYRDATHSQGSGNHIYSSSGGYGYGSTTTYKLYVNVTIANTGNVPAHIDGALFTSYWDDDKLSYYEDVESIELAPGEQTTVHLVYRMNKAQYNSWNSSGHRATIKIQYGNDSIEYIYLTDTHEITVVQ